MSEITSDYVGDPNVHRWKVPAKGTKLSGSGTKSGYAWLIDHRVSLPSKLIDSDFAASEVSGGPTIRFSTDEDGVNQISCHVVTFTPASGGVGGGAKCEIWLPADTYEGGVDKDFWIWWITGGSQTQPAAGDTYGADGVYSGIEFISHDGGLTDSSPNHHSNTDTGTASGTPMLGLSARNYGSGDKIQTPVFMENATGGFTVMLWTDRTSSSARIPWSQNTSTSGAYLDNQTSDIIRLKVDGSVVQLTITGVYTSGNYVHVTVTYDPTNGYALYADNNTPQTSATTSFPSFSATTNGVQWGNWETSNLAWIGDLDECWLIFASIDSDQRQTLYNNQSDPSTFWDSTNAVEDGPFSATEPSAIVYKSFTSKPVVRGIFASSKPKLGGRSL